MHPIGAGIEVRLLALPGQDLEKQLEQTEGQLSENADRIGIMDEHLSNVQQELKYTQSRVRPDGRKHAGQPLQPDESL